MSEKNRPLEKLEEWDLLACACLTCANLREY